jgi:cell division protein FtsL
MDATADAPAAETHKTGRVSSRAKKIFRQIWSHIKSIAQSTKFFLLWLYTAGFALATLSLVIVTLAAYQFQARIAEIEAKFQTRIAEIEATNADDGTSSKAENTDAGILSKVELASELRALRADYRLFRRYADDRWAIYLDAERRVRDKSLPELYARIREERHRECPWLEPLRLRELPPDDVSSGALLVSLRGQPAVASEDLPPRFASSTADEDPALASAIEAHQEYLNYEKIVHELVPDKDANPDLFTLYQDMMYFEHLKIFTLGIIDPMTLAVMPAWMLTLIVTLAMGALGSVLHVARSYLDETSTKRYDYHPVSWFFLRPLLGVVTAFAVFVFLQAGLALTDDKLTQSSLNPFFIAFIAILSGLMSWQAVESIQRWGERFLGEEETRNWAYGLKGAFDMKREKTVAELAAFLKLEECQIRLWMAEQQPVPQDVQEKIAVWFGIDRRHLFSEQK